MKFLRQIRFEVSNILRSRFLLILAILVLAWSVVSPVIGLFAPKDQGGYPIPRPLGGVFIDKMAYSSYYVGGKDGGNQESVTVKGVTITSDSPLYWYLSDLVRQQNDFQANQSSFTKPEALDLLLSWIDSEIDYYLEKVQYVVAQQDYRLDLIGMGVTVLDDKLIYSYSGGQPDVLQEACNYRKGMDPAAFKKKYVDITAEERMAAIDKADEFLASVTDVVKNDNFPKYIGLRIEQSNQQIADLNDNIAIQEKAIIDNPASEESINQMIEQFKMQIKMLETNTIPILQFRLEKGIKPGADVWQNRALSDVENYRNQIVYTTIMTEDQFTKDVYLVQQFGSYQRYVDKMQQQINEYNNKVLIAQNSLDAGKPDMKYVTNGSRTKTVTFLDYSVFVALLGVLLGGWQIASEFQQGTVRLLMIRPKTRAKILLSKCLGAFAVCLAVYFAGALLNFIATGICYGFSDFAYPNYTITGEVNFFAYWLPKLLLCVVPIAFGFAVAFMLSVVVKNAAVAIAVPVVCYVGCFLALSRFAFSKSMEWIAWTPVPFVQLSSFFVPDSIIQSITQNGGVALSMPYGIGLMLALSAICMFVAAIVFKKRDITN